MSNIVERLRELEGQTDAFAKNQHHSFVTTQKMARESAAACREAADIIDDLVKALEQAALELDEAASIFESNMPSLASVFRHAASNARAALAKAKQP